MSIATPPERPQAGPDVEDGIYFPSSDGRPMGETGWHVISTLTLYAMIREHLGDRDAYVAANMFLYYERANPRANRSPDCMVILGVPRLPERRSFKVWKEGAMPSVIFEFASKDTYRDDLKAKRILYERLGVAEYFLFDPIEECLKPTLQGMRLENGRYVDLVLDDGGGLTSAILGLRFVPDGFLLRPIDLRTGYVYLTIDETTAAARAQSVRLDEERRNAEQQRLRADEERRNAEAERRRAEEQRRNAEQQRLRADEEHQNAERQHLRADEERRNAEAERRRADSLAAEVERLKALIGRGDPGGHAEGGSS